MPLPWLDRCRRLRGPAYALVVVLASIGTLAIAWSGPTFRTLANDSPPAAPPEFSEAIVEPHASNEAETSFFQPPHCNCWMQCFEDQPTYFLTGFGGASYFDSEPDTSLGGAYGLNFWLPLYGGL